MNNYETARLKACGEFSKLNIEEIVSNNDLECNEDWIFLTYLYRKYKISKKTGIVFFGEQEASYSETLSIFDLLCHRGEKHISGEFASVNSLNGGPVSSGVPMESTGKFADLIDANKEKFINYSLKIGAKQLCGGDICFEYSVFKDLKMRIKFYASDDEFPASATLLYEKNTLSFVNYETAFYIAGDLQRLIEKGLAD